MFEELRAAFREAIDNFHRELNRDRVPETMDHLLRGMRKELVDVRARISQLEDQVASARGEAAREAEQVRICRRRRDMALRIDDHETAEVAAAYEAKHEQRRAVLEDKAAALQQELDFRRKEADDMAARFEEARRQRAGLEAATGRTEARRTLSEADELFAELDRMAEKVEGTRAAAEAAEVLGAELGQDAGNDFEVELDARPSEADVDAALAELKRRMAEQERNGGSRR